MDRQLGTGAVAGILVVVVLVVGLVAWKVFGGHGTDEQHQMMKQQGIQQDYMRMRGGPYGGAPGAPPGGR